MNKFANFLGMTVLVGALAAGNVAASIYSNQITAFIAGTGENFNGESVQQALKAGDELCRKIEGDSIVLLKNDDALPLAPSVKAVNLFGYGATDDGFLLRGVGSGSSTISNKKKKTLVTALEEYGYEVNKDILRVYENFAKNNANRVRPNDAGSGNVYRLAEPNVSEFSAGLLADAQDFSDVAIFVISRDGGENVGEIPTDYLDITAAEQAHLDMLKANFGTVIVLLNTTNTMHTGFLNDAGISAALYVGITGQSGAMAIGSILGGDITPSGKVTDTYTYVSDYDPSFANRVKANSSIQYVEDIYYGYKWYETAYADGYFNNVSTAYGSGYDGVVQYPFGYGLSYTSFSWTVAEVTPNGGALNKNSKITVSVDVKNTGTVAGKDVVELYYTPPYTPGGVEKAAINLLDFAKTTTLEPGKTQRVTLSFSAYDMASYDCYDKNDNGKATYELDAGNYAVKLMNDAHTVDDCAGAVINFNVPSTIVFDKDPVTGNTVENHFTGDAAYAGVPTDASTVGGETQYFTRASFATTFPTSHARTPSNNPLITAAANFMNPVYNAPVDSETHEEVEPVTGVDSGLRLVTVDNANKTPATLNQLTGVDSSVKLAFNEDLMQELGDYDAEAWDTLLDQMTKDELKKLVELGGFHTQAIVSVGKPLNTDYDGPAGFNTNSLTGNWSGKSPDTDSWTAYPSEALIGCCWNKEILLEMGLSMGAEGAATSCNGWYAPGVNLHRSAYTARNYEYYSEDGVLSGKLAAQIIKGAKINGLYCYLKHFACSEPGDNPKDLNTWLTEQNLRENYLRPFEIAVKEGEANAIMTAFNRVGASWAGANYAMNVQVLREEWGFRGSLITDWTAGDGLGSMYTRQGVRSGNDLWLNPNATGINNPLDMNNATDVACARRAAHNILYTYVDTHNYSTNYDRSQLDDIYNVQLGISFKEQVFPWWIPVLGGVDALALVVVFFWAKAVIKSGKEEYDDED